MVVADQDHVGDVQSILELMRVEKRIVVAERLIEFAEILATAVRILGADFALDSGQRLELSGAASSS
jgi:hypothetical protein